MAEHEHEQRNEPETDVPEIEPERLLLRESFAAYIPTVWKGQVVCPICGNTTWSGGDVVDLPVRYANRPEANVYSLMPVLCNVCGYTIFFNAKYAGLFDDAGDPKMFEQRPEQLTLREEPASEPESSPGDEG